MTFTGSWPWTSRDFSACIWAFVSSGLGRSELLLIHTIPEIPFTVGVEAKTVVSPPLQEGKGVIYGPSPLRIYVLVQLCSACGRNGMDGLDLPLPPPPPCSAPGMPGPLSGLGCAIPGRRPRQLTTRCLDQRPSLQRQLSRLRTPSLVSWSFQSGSGDTQVNRPSQLRGVSVSGGSTGLNPGKPG